MVTSLWVNKKIYTQMEGNRGCSVFHLSKFLISLYKILKHAGKSLVEIGFCFFDKKLICRILQFWQTYKPLQRWDDWSWLEKFVGICLLSGYHTLPQVVCFGQQMKKKNLPVWKILPLEIDCGQYNTIYIYQIYHAVKNDRFAKILSTFKIMNGKFD